MKEQILGAFSELGFKLETDDDWYYKFSYEGLNYVYINDDSDDDFLGITLPGIYDITYGNELRANALIQKINSGLKYIKAYVVSDSIWLFYERKVVEGEDFENIISQMVSHLEHAAAFTFRAIEEMDRAETDDDDCPLVG